MIEIKNISYSYGKNHVLKDISFKLEAGECVGILGTNGAGKSTLITCLNRILSPKTGSLYIDGQDILTLSRLDVARHISYVAQKNELSQITVFDSVLLGRKPYIKWAISQEDIDICEEAIQQIGMSGFKLRYINELSGGELQKVMLARALVQQPKLLLLDEPTSNLDPKNQYEMLALVKELARERKIGVLMVLHDLSLALRYCDRFLFMRDGEVFRYGGQDVVTADTVYQVYDVGASIVEVDGRRVVVID